MSKLDFSNFIYKQDQVQNIILSLLQEKNPSAKTEHIFYMEDNNDDLSKVVTEIKSTDWIAIVKKHYIPEILLCQCQVFITKPVPATKTWGEFFFGSSKANYALNTQEMTEHLVLGTDVVKPITIEFESKQEQKGKSDQEVLDFLRKCISCNWIERFEELYKRVETGFKKQELPDNERYVQVGIYIRDFLMQVLQRNSQFMEKYEKEDVQKFIDEELLAFDKYQLTKDEIAAMRAFLV